MSEELYDHLNKMRDSGSCKSSLFLSNRCKTSLEQCVRANLGESYKQPYYWAPFALPGLWFFLDS